MDVLDLLLTLRAKGTTISLDDTANTLRLRGKTENLTAQDKELIRTHKTALMDFIRTERTKQQGFTTIPAVAPQADYALSDGQRRLWYLSQAEDHALTYNIPSVLELAGALDAELFERAIQAVLERHEILRTVFRENAAGEPRQQVLPELAFGLRRVDLCGQADGEEQARALIRQDLQVPFDLGCGPLIRATLFQLAADRHVFYYNLHHIISDGWSMQLLVKDVLSNYLAFGQGQASPLAPLSMQYKDYAAWLEQQLSGDSLRALETYWTQQFAGEIPVIQLPSANPRPAVLSNKGAAHTIALDGPTTAQLRNLSQQLGGTLFMGLLTAVNGLLCRYTGQEDIVIGSPIAGREHADLDEQIGFYVNTLALRTRFSADDSFEALFEKVKATTLGAFQHQLFPFDRLVETLGLRRDPSRNPLFDVMLNLQPAGVTSAAAPGEAAPLASRDFAISQEVASKFDLSFRCYEQQDALTIRIEYNTDVLEAYLIEQLGRHLVSFVAAALQDPRQAVAAIDYIPAEEQATLALVNPRENLPHDSGSLLAEFGQVVSRFGSRVAVSGMDGSQLTYAELDAWSSRLAHFLLAQAGGGALDVVALQLPQGAAAVVGVLACWKAGAAYLPLDAALPAARRAHVLTHSQARLTLTAELYARFEASAAAYPATAPAVAPAAEPVAYVIYTSGSTGAPKGVAVGHASLRNYVRWFQAEAGLTERDAAALLTSYGFDLGYTTLFPALLSGAELCVAAPERVLQDAAGTLAWLGSRRVSVLKLTPSLVQGLLLACGAEALARVGALRLLVCGGAAMAAADMAALLQSNPALAVFNHYGPTEATIGVCFQPLTGASIGAFAARPVLGGPIANAELLVVDARRRPVPAGVVGELLVGGAPVAQGYWREPGLTAQKFVTLGGRRYYRTGDQVVRQPDGRLRFVGRFDDQVKVRGYRVELGDVQHALLQQAQVAQVAVVTVADDNGQLELAAYVVPASGENIDVNALRAALHAQLPAYMVPAHLVVLDALPVNANGKLDRKALPDPTQSAQAQRAAHYQAPQGEVETALAEVWTSVLRRASIGREDNFYDLGGDSIKAVMVVSRLKQAGYSLKVSDVLRTPVLRELARHAQLLTRQIDQAPATGMVALSPIQHDFFGRTSVDRQHYNQSILLTSRERLAEESLRLSLARLLAHHDALRLRFTFEEATSSWCQHYAAVEETPVALHVYDLAGLSAGEAAAAQLRLSEQLQAGFELAAGPLLQAAVFRQADGTDELLLVAHHLVVDGVSWRILLEDLSALYAQARQGQALRLPAKTDAVQAWHAQQQRYALSPALQAELRYWQAQDQAAVPALPKDEPAGSNLVQDAQVQSFLLPAAATEQLLTEAHRAYGAEAQDVLLAALAQALQAEWGLAQVRLTLEGHGREWIGAELDVTRTVGWFTSKYPLLLDLTPAADAVDALVEVKEAVRRVPGKGIGYGLLRYLHPEAPLAGAPDADIVFNYLGDFGGGATGNDEPGVFNFSGKERGASASARRERPAVLEVSALVVEGQLRVSVTYSQAQYQQQTITRLLSSYEQQLTALVAAVAATGQRQVTPSDLTFAGLTRAELAALQQQVGPVQDVYELTPLQEGMYYYWVQDPASRAHGIQVAYRLQGQLQVDVLAESYQQLVQSYDALRTCFTHQYAGRALQVVLPHVSGGFSFVDLSHLTGEELTQAVAAEKEADLAKGYDLTRGSQMRLHVLALGADEFEFIWSHHHVIMDGWCSRLLTQQFIQLYQSKVGGQAVQLTERYKYADYLRWLRQRDPQTSLAYWQQYLSGYEQPAGLPTKTGAAPEAAYAQAEVSLQVEPALVEQVQGLCRQQGLTLSTLVQSIWGVLLSRYTNTPDVVFGTVVSGRPGDLVGVEEMVGLFINTIPVRVQYDGSQSVRSLLQQVQQQHIACEPHHYSPLGEVRNRSALGRDLFNHVLVFENLDNEAPAESPLQAEAALQITGRDLYESTNFDFHINCIPTSDSLRLEFKYNTNLYEPSFIAALKEHFRILLTAFVTDPEQVVDAVDHLTPAEKHRLLVELNDTAVEYPLDQTVVDLFRAQVAHTPQRTAVVSGATTLTYEQLDAVTNQLAQYLVAEYGVQANDFVGIQLERSAWLLIAVLGTLKAGAAYVPIDPEYPQERIDYIRQDSASKVLLDEQELGRFRAAQARYAAQWTAPAPQPTDLAYAIYTSGTTGRPKGVPIQHRNLTNYISYAAQTYCTKACAKVMDTCSNPNCRAKAGSTFPLFTSFSFDLTVTSIFAPLVTGGKVVVYGQEGLDEVLPDVFWGNQGISVVKCTPTHVGVLSELGQRPTAVQKIIVGGEQLKDKHVAYLLSINPDMEIYNEYGPTETTVGATVAKIDQHQRDITIGGPIANTQVYVLDRRGQLAAVGVAGEIVIAGQQLSAGYLNRPELSAAKFVPHPYEPGAFIYLTGDTGKVLPDGNLLYFGRRDDQVKVRGYRIELGEVENALLLRDDITQAVVVASEIGDEKVLVAYFTSPEPVLLPELKGFLAATLPDYMVPAYLVQLKELPVTVNGKVDKRQLPRPDSVDSGAEFGPVAPRNAVEEKLLAIWKQVLKKDDLGIRSNFFDLGGDSIKIILLVAKIKSGFKIALDSAKLFYATTIEEQAALILAVTEQEAGPGVAPAQRSYPLTEIQEVYWAVCQDPATSVAYNISMAYQLIGPLQVDKLKTAFAQLQARHEVLRTVFRYDDEAYNVRQWVLPQEQLPEAFIVQDRQGELRSPDELMALVGQELTKPFDFVNGPLIRLQVVQYQPDECLVLFNMHHIISDAFSIQIIVRELFTLYCNQVADQTLTLPVLPIQFKDYADWSRNNRKETKLAESAGFWKNYLAGYESQIRFPWRKTGVAGAFRADVHRQTIDNAALVGQLRSWIGQEKGTLYMALLTLFKALCYLETEQTDLTLVTPVSTRDHEEVKDLVGLFLNTVFVRTQVEAQDSFASLFRKVQATVKEVMLHKQFPYLSIVDQVHKSQEQPFFNVGFNLNPLNAHAAESELDLGLELRPLTKEENFVKAQLWLDITEQEHALLISYSYQQQLFEERDMQQFAAALERLLGQVMQAPTRPLRDIQDELLAALRQEQKENARKLRSANRMKLMTGKLS